MSTLATALKKAKDDQAFGTELLSNPEKFRQEYNLTDAQIGKLKKVAEDMGDLMSEGQTPPGGIYY